MDAAEPWQPNWPAGLPRADVDHLTVAVSDIEMGAGGLLDDFPQTDWLGRVLLGYADGPFRQVAITLVFNGDTFDLIKTSHGEAWPTHVDAAVALDKMRRIAAAHPEFFAAVRTFLRSGAAARKVVFLVGNHDAELLFPEVQAELRTLCDPPHDDAVTFPGFAMRHGDLHVEHGSQRDPMFAIDPDALFVESNGRRFLNLPWGSIALLEVAIPLTPILHHHDRLIPRHELFELMPEMRDLLLGAFWRYWTHDYWQSYFEADDPLRKVSWTMLK